MIDTRSAGARHVVTDLEDTIRGSTLIEELELRADAVGNTPGASAHGHGHEVEVTLIDQAGPQGLPREIRTADADVARGRLLQSLDRGRIEIALDACPRTGDLLEGPRVHDLVGRAPDRR